jgi:GcrA cell cycle regulator
MNNNVGPSIWTDELVAELTRLWAEGYSQSLIAEKMGITRNMVCGKVHRLDLPPPLIPKTCLERVRRSSSGERKTVRRQPKPRKRVITNYESVRAVRANGNSNAMRLIKSITTDLPTLRCVEIDPRLVTLEDLHRGECRYPYGDGPFLFCGHAAAVGSSYCKAHKELCSEPPRAPIHRFARVAA